MRIAVCVCHFTALVDLPCCHFLPSPLGVCRACVHSCVCVCVCVCVSVRQCARMHGHAVHTLLLGLGISPPGPGIFCACLSACRGQLCASSLSIPRVLSSLCVSPSLWLWYSQSCSMVACPEPRATSLPIFSLLPAPPFLLMRCSSLVPEQVFSAPFLSLGWTEPGLTTQLLGQRAQLPKSSMESGCTQGLAWNGQIQGFSVVPHLSHT